jgi:hypothetical protein
VKWKWQGFHEKKAESRFGRQGSMKVASNGAKVREAKGARSAWRARWWQKRRRGS